MRPFFRLFLHTAYQCSRLCFLPDCGHRELYISCYFHCVESPWKPKLIEMFQPANCWNIFKTRKPAAGNWKRHGNGKGKTMKNIYNRFLRSWPLWGSSVTFSGIWGELHLGNFKRSLGRNGYKPSILGFHLSLPGWRNMMYTSPMSKPPEAGLFTPSFGKKHGGIIQSHETSSKIIKK